MVTQAKQTRGVPLDAAFIGPLFMLSAALSFTMSDVLDISGNIVAARGLSGVALAKASPGRLHADTH